MQIKEKFSMVLRTPSPYHSVTQGVAKRTAKLLLTSQMYHHFTHHYIQMFKQNCKTIKGIFVNGYCSNSLSINSYCSYDLSMSGK